MRMMTMRMLKGGMAVAGLGDQAAAAADKRRLCWETTGPPMGRMGVGVEVAAVGAVVARSWLKKDLNCSPRRSSWLDVAESWLKWQF